jgi:hypothetical protein
VERDEAHARVWKVLSQYSELHPEDFEDMDLVTDLDPNAQELSGGDDDSIDSGKLRRARMGGREIGDRRRKAKENGGVLGVCGEGSGRCGVWEKGGGGCVLLCRCAVGAVSVRCWGWAWVWVCVGAFMASSWWWRLLLQRV